MFSQCIRRIVFCLLCALPFSAMAEPVWIYVPAEKEKNSRHIEGDVHLSIKEVVDGVVAQFPEKDTDIRLYCRSGSRASVAASALIKAGYTNVQNVGSVGDAISERGL